MFEPSIEHLKSSREEIEEVSSHLSKATFDRKKSKSASVLEPYRSHIQTLVAGLYINFVMYIPFYFWILIAFIVVNIRKEQSVILRMTDFVLISDMLWFPWTSPIVAILWLYLFGSQTTFLDH